MKTWTLLELARRLGADHDRVEGGDCNVGGIAIDSRQVRRGDLFAALPGTLLDGRAFVDDALVRGAAALLLPSAGAEHSDRAAAAPARSERALAIPRLFSSQPRRAAGRIAHLLAGEPAEGLRLLGVTGTNGKSTCVHLLQHLLARKDESWGVLGTLRYETGAGPVASDRTTPDPIRLASYLAASLAAGQTGLAMEVSSHALDQDRVAGCRYAGVLFTNLSRDHLDYHGDMERYFAAKSRLLALRRPGAPALVNADDPWMSRLAAGPAADCLRYGQAASADFRLRNAVLDAAGARFVLTWPGGEGAFRSQLAGEFNLSNAVGCLALALSLGADPAALAERLASFPGLPGRMEGIVLDGGPTVIIDFAHSPDAVKQVLAACRALVAAGGKLVALLGAGGDRDRGKRPLMGAALQAASDRCWLSSDNPRSEDPEAILDDMEGGMDAAGAPWRREADRALAIRQALAACADGDVLALLGKGHEASQEIAEQFYPFSDRREVEAAWREAGGSA